MKVHRHTSRSGTQEQKAMTEGVSEVGARGAPTTRLSDPKAAMDQPYRLPGPASGKRSTFTRFHRPRTAFPLEAAAVAAAVVAGKEKELVVAEVEVEVEKRYTRTPPTPTPDKPPPPPRAPPALLDRPGAPSST